MGRGQLPATLAGLEAPPARRSRLRWTPVALLAGAAVLLLVQVVSSALPARPAAALTAAPVARATVAAIPASRPSPPAPPAPTAPTGGNPLSMTEDQRARTRTDLASLGGRLPTGVSLTAPAAWARWAGSTPSYARDLDGCPHIAAKLADGLGGGK